MLLDNKFQSFKYRKVVGQDYIWWTLFFLNSFIQQGNFILIKSDSKDISNI